MGVFCYECGLLTCYCVYAQIYTHVYDLFCLSHVVLNSRKTMADDMQLFLQV